MTLNILILRGGEFYLFSYLVCVCVYVCGGILNGPRESVRGFSCVVKWKMASVSQVNQSAEEVEKGEEITNKA